MTNSPQGMGEHGDKGGREARPERRHNRRVASGEGRLLPLQTRASFVPKAEIHEG